MSIETLYTTHSGAGQIKTASAAVRGSAPQLQGLNFLDVILARIAETGGEKPLVVASDNGGKQPLQSENQLLNTPPALSIDKKPNPGLAKLIAENPELAKEIKNFSLDQQATLSEILALNKEAFDGILKSIKNGTIVVQGLGAETEKLTDLPQILETLSIDGQPREDRGGGYSTARHIFAAIERLLAHEQANPGFIATNLTPERITSIRNYYTRIQNIINNGEDSSGNIDDQAIAGVTIGLIRIVPVQNRSEANAIKTLTAPGIASASPDGAKPSNDILSRLNALVKDSTGSVPTPLGEESSAQGLPEKNDRYGFEKILKQTSNQKGTKTAHNFTNNSANNSATDTPQIRPDLSVLQSWTSSLTGSLSATGEWVQDIGMPGTASVTDTANFTQLVTQAGHASRSHPATQMVAATIQKSMGSDGNRNIVLQLDPPELGKVEVSMNFGKDKSVKITIISEKPEAYMMLQRDAQGLERILANAGLDVEGGMNFELANEGHDFNHNGGHDGRDGHGSGQNGENGEDLEIIESTMTWHVDPETGHMRYNIMA